MPDSFSLTTLVRLSRFSTCASSLSYRSPLGSSWMTSRSRPRRSGHQHIRLRKHLQRLARPLYHGHAFARQGTPPAPGPPPPRPRQGDICLCDTGVASRDGWLPGQRWGFERSHRRPGPWRFPGSGHVLPVPRSPDRRKTSPGSANCPRTLPMRAVSLALWLLRTSGVILPEVVPATLVDFKLCAVVVQRPYLAGMLGHQAAYD